MKKIEYKGDTYKLFTEEEHIKKHTSKENTYSDECLYCNFSNYEVKQIIKRWNK